MQLKIELLEISNQSFAKIISDEIIFKSIETATDIMAEAFFSGVLHIIAEKKHFASDFFDLKTKLAGEILQKFSNYRMKLAIVGDFTNIKSKSLNDFILESNKIKQIIFVSSVEEAIEKFNK